MRRPHSPWRFLRHVGVAGLSCLAWVAGIRASFAEPPDSVGDSRQVLSIEGAVRLALENNPELAAFRVQHGIAAAGVVIARTYPYNPILDSKARGNSGPSSAGITNPVSTEHKLLFQVEVRRQGTYRRQVAQATLSRTDWEIAFLEVALAVRTERAFNSVLYRQQKLQLIEETVQLNERAAEQIGRLFEADTLRGPEVIASRGDAIDARAQLSPARAALARAQFDLRGALGFANENFELQGSLETPSPQLDAETLMRETLENRADLHAYRAGVDEAGARLRLQIADRYGNPIIGPDYELDPTSVSAIGAQLELPLPVFNTHAGEIQQREAEQVRAIRQVRQSELLVEQELQAALARFEEAKAGVDLYRTQVLPQLRVGLHSIERLYSRGAPGDFPRVVDFRRRLLKARDAYLDALFELSQARADLAAAAGNPALGFAL